MTNHATQLIEKKNKQVYRPIESLAHGTSCSDMLAFRKHRRCIEGETVELEEEIVWNGRHIAVQDIPVSLENLSISSHTKNAAASALQQEEPMIVHFSDQNPTAADCQYGILKGFLEKRSIKAPKPVDPQSDLSHVDEPNKSKAKIIKSSSRTAHNVDLGCGYKYVKKSSLRFEDTKKTKEHNVSPLLQSDNALANATGGVPAKPEQKCRRRNTFLHRIAQQGIDEGEITVSQPFSSHDKLKVGQTKVTDILVTNNGKRLVNLECVRLLYAKPRDSIELTVNSDAEQTPIEAPLKLSKALDSPLLGPYSLLPGSTLSFRLSCTPKVVGYHKAVLLFDLGKHKVLRCMDLVAEDDIARVLSASEPYLRPTVKGFQTSGRPVYGPPPPSPRFAKTLGAYPMRPGIERSLRNNQMPRIFKKQLSFESYREYFSALMYAEELQWKEDIRAYDLHNVTMEHDKSGLLALRVQGLLERRPSVIYRDTILVKPVDSNKTYQGYVYSVQADVVLLKFHVSFHKKSIPNQCYDVRFSYSRITLRRCLHAIKASKNLDSNFLFPTFIPSPVHSHGNNFIPINHVLNEEQKQSVMEILMKAGGPPYLVYGPPGTGKTVTIVEAILQTLKLKPNSKVLACAPSNYAADVLLDRLRCHIQVMDILRVNAYSRPLNDVAPELWPYCYVEGSFFRCPSTQSLKKYKVFVTTYSSAAMLEAQGLEPGHFSHIFLDECGQGLEPEAMIALANFVTENTVVLLAGDHQQLGPIIRSPIAQKFGLGVSLLERLSTLPLYSRSSGDNADEFDKTAVTKLVRNYRSHPAILYLPSQLFYDGELIACATHEIRNSLCGWEELPNINFPVLFYGIEGKDEREGRSSSWFNAQEASKVVELVLMLKQCGKNQLNDSDIGIISPYSQQVKKIKIALALKNITSVKTGSVEQFQGQERKVIIISTVRSSQEFIKSDQVNQIGFLDNPKRFNVAITRAKALLIIVGNPYVLSEDSHWGELFTYCVVNKSYVGCPPPTEITPETTELNEYVDLLYAAAQNTTGYEDGADANATAFETPWSDPRC